MTAPNSSTWVQRADRNLVRASALLLAAFSFFPYWRIVPLGTDIQPNALVLASVVWLATWRVRMPPAIFMLALPASFALALLVLGPWSFVTIRTAANYVALWVIAFAAYATLRWRDWLSPRVLKGVVAAWFLVGLAQVLIDPHFLVAIVNPGARAAAGGGRGVVSLATEPAHYATFCLLLYILIQHRAAYDRLTSSEATVLKLLLATQVLFFARSALGAILLGAVIGTEIILRHRGAPLRAALIFGGLGVAAIAAMIVAATSVGIELGRLGRVAQALWADPVVFFRIDGSANNRLFHAVGPFWAAVRNGLMPYGFGAWDDFVQQAPIASEGFFWAVSTERIMSGYGATVFELGVVGLLIPAAITIAIRRASSDWREALITSAPFHLIMTVTGPLAKPIAALIIGYFAAAARRQEGTADG